MRVGEPMLTVRLPTGTLTFEELPSATSERSVPDHAFVEVLVKLTREETELIRREQAMLSVGYEFSQRPILANYFALMPDGSLETVLDGRVVYREADLDKVLDLVKHWDFRRQQRANRKRRAARKSKRGWA
jgi:hypothetical protein